MSSTTERQRGQVLAIFALSLVVVLGAGALAFDGGMMILERRDQQNAADAAATAGARYVKTSHAQAKATAVSVATANGFTDGDGLAQVIVNVPPRSGKFATFPNAIQVQISNTRPSILGAIMGFMAWPVSASATAATLDGIGGPYSILSLEPSECEAMKVSGTGSVVAHGNIQVDSDCPTSAMMRQAGGTIQVIGDGGCNVVGGIQNEGGDPEAYLQCDTPEDVRAVGDVLSDLDGPDPPLTMPADVQQVGGNPKKIPNGCPGGSSAATWETPATCHFTSNYKDTAWRLFPGSYPGGLKLLAGTFYLEPGIYYIGGGGLEITGNGTETITVISNTTTYGGGVMFYNSEATGSPAGAMKLDGSSANMQLLPLEDKPGQRAWAGMIIFQDREINDGNGIDGDDLTINGNSSIGLNVRGTIYLPNGDVKVNGNAGDLVMDQIIAKTFVANGNEGAILALKDKDHIYKFVASGLVE